MKLKLNRRDALKGLASILLFPTLVKGEESEGERGEAPDTIIYLKFENGDEQNIYIKSLGDGKFKAISNSMNHASITMKTDWNMERFFELGSLTVYPGSNTKPIITYIGKDKYDKVIYSGNVIEKVWKTL